MRCRAQSLEGCGGCVVEGAPSLGDRSGASEVDGEGSARSRPVKHSDAEAGTLRAPLESGDAGGVAVKVQVCGQECAKVAHTCAFFGRGASLAPHVFLSPVRPSRRPCRSAASLNLKMETGLRVGREKKGFKVEKNEKNVPSARPARRRGVRAVPATRRATRLCHASPCLDATHLTRPPPPPFCALAGVK